MAIPNFLQARKQGAEAPPIGALRTVSSAQTIFFYREEEKGAGGRARYASHLRELAERGMIDAVLASGTKQGYVYTMNEVKVTDDATGWNCRANPQAEGDAGRRSFYVDESGVIRFATDGPAGPRSPEIGR